MWTCWCCNTLSWSYLPQSKLVNLAELLSIKLLKVLFPFHAPFPKTCWVLVFRPVDWFHKARGRVLIGMSFAYCGTSILFSVNHHFRMRYKFLWKGRHFQLCSHLLCCYWMYNRTVIFWLVNEPIFHLCLPKCCLIPLFYPVTHFTVHSCLDTPSVSTTWCLSCLCGHLASTVDLSFVQLCVHLKGYKCG